jgi:hypothetical protein
MLFTGAAVSSGRVQVADGGVVDHRDAGFAYTSSDELVIDTSNAPQNFIKGVGIRNTGAVCATTTTTGTTVVEGVRLSPTGQVVFADAAAQAVTSGNPIRTNGALAVALSAMFGMFLATQSGDFIVTDSGDELEVGL